MKRLTSHEVKPLLKRIPTVRFGRCSGKDLRDCLLIQLSQFDKTTPWLEEARLIISYYLDSLANHDLQFSTRVTRLKERCAERSRQSDSVARSAPRQSIQTGEPEYVIPDGAVRKHNGHWTVDQQPTASPRLQINQHYQRFSPITRATMVTASLSEAFCRMPNGGLRVWKTVTIRYCA